MLQTVVAVVVAAVVVATTTATAAATFLPALASCCVANVAGIQVHLACGTISHASTE